MAKVKWFEEQKVSKQTAIDNAVKLAESEWQAKLEKALEEEVDKRVEEGMLAIQKLLNKRLKEIPERTNG